MLSLQTISELQAQRAYFAEQIKHLDAILGSSDVSEGSFQPDGYTGIIGDRCPYKKSDNYKERFASILKRANRFLSINEMATMINGYEPKVSIKDAKSSLASAKNLLLKDGAIVKHQVGSNYGNTFYGSPAWLGDDGQPKKEFMYSEDAVQIKKKIEI